jgi:hypothetical protein
MAAPITHIVLANKVFDKFFPDKNRKDFFIGTVFPDIRYLGCIKREETHLPQIGLKEIQEDKNSFMSGFKFHSLVDIINKNFICSGIFANSYSEHYAIINFVEEELFYNKVKDWNEIIKFYDGILPEEKNFNTNIKDTGIKKWHQIIQNDFYNAPSNESRQEIARAVNFPEDVILKILKTTEELKKDEKVINAIKDFYNNFESLLSNY